jgi:secreted trypsin-like serine protease
MQDYVRRKFTQGVCPDASLKRTEMLMRTRLLIVLAAALAVLTTGGPAHAITNGQHDNGAHPYVGQLLFFVPDETDPRFDDPGAWFSCSGTLLNDHIVLTAGHCTYGTGKNGASTTANGGSGSGGTDVWISFSEAPDFSILKPSSTYARNENPKRYHDWSTALNASADWHAATSFPHTQFDPNAFYLHDAGVLNLREPAPMRSYGKLPSLGFLDQFQTSARNDERFTVVGYGLTKVLPFADFGGDTRERGTVQLVTLQGLFGLPYGVAARFTNNNGAVHQGGTCFGDSGGPTFHGSTNVVVAVTSFGISPNCTGTDDEYRVDQADDLAFLATFGV